jgi:hypothetical protein
MKSNMKFKKLFVHLPLAALLIGITLMRSALAQTAGGTISGSIKDPSGSVIPSGLASVVNVETGVKRAVLANETGLYRAPNLQPGTYEITVSAPGFANQVRKGVSLNVGGELVVDFEMKVGNVVGTVEVAAQNAEVDLATATVSRMVDGSTIRELPINGRDWTQLATLEPGISAIGGGGGGSRGGNGVKLTVSGARPSENNFRLDGLSLNDSSNSTPGSTLGTNLGVESVREFSIVSNNYSAEYGRATGAVINAVTRSGTNDLHGTLFYFHRNSALDARNFFDVNGKPSFRRHQFGAAAGGPIVKNRTFWFANYEGLREFLAETQISNTLSASAREGRLSTGDVTVDPRIARMFGLLPLPNGPLLGAGATGQYILQRDKVSQGRYLLGKVDHRFSNSASLSGTYFHDEGDTSAPDAFRTQRTGDSSRRDVATTEFTYLISPSVISVSRVGYSRSDNSSGVIKQIYNPLLEDRSLGFLPGYTIGATTVTGITVPGSGPGSTNVNLLVFNSYQVHQNLYISRGIQALKFGFTLERMQYNLDSPNRNGGDFQFGSISDFLTNRPTSFAALYPGSDTRRGLRQTMLAGYIQDDLRLRKNFSLNIGVRYEFLTIPTEVNGKIALLPDLKSPTVRVGGPVHDRNPTLKNFSPRIGLVWDPFKDGRTSIRSSFGVFDSLPLLWLYDTPLTRSTPFFVQGVSTSIPQGSFPDQAYPLIRAGALRTAYVDVKPPRAYSLKWNFSIQRDMWGWLTEVGYTASRGLHLPLVERNMNTVQPIPTPQGWVFDPNGTVLNPNFASINTTDTWNSDSTYHGLQLSVKRNLASGLLVVGSYAWSKSLDTASSTGSTAANSGYTGASAAVTPLIPGLNWGLSEFDLRHNLTLSLVWKLPLAKSSTGVPRLVLNGWQLGTIYRANTGNPFSVALSSDRAGSRTDTTGAALGQRPDLLLLPGCETLTNPGNPNRYIKTECFAFPAAYKLGNLGRNTLTKPGLSNVDLSLFRNLRFSERLNAQFRAEFFNALNHANFATPANLVFDRQGRIPADAGLITSTATDGRRIQFGLKLNF